MPELSNVHIDTFLTTLSIGYQNKKYVASDVFPVIPVDKRSDKYWIYNRDTFLRSSGKDAQGKSNSIRRPGTRSQEITWDGSNQSFYCEQLARSYPLTDVLEKYADNPIQPDIDATMSLMATVMLDNEISVAGVACNRSNFASANKSQLVNGTTSWATTSTPYSTTQTSFPLSVDIPNAQKAINKSLIEPPNKLLVNYASAVTLAANWEYLRQFIGVSTEGLTKGGLVPVIRGLDVVEATPQYATSAEGVTAVTTGYVWVDDQSPAQDVALVYYANPAITGLRTVTFGLTFESPDETLGTRGFVTLRWLEQWRRSQLIEVSTVRDWRFPATDASSNGLASNGFASGGFLISGTTL